MLHRLLKLPISHSFFLFGARGTGKTTLLERFFPRSDAYWIDLLQSREQETLEDDPDSLERRALALPGSVRWIVIDEIQKVPALLDIVHRLIEMKRWNFALTGSSARKLKAGGANLLAGRAFTYELFPLTAAELGARFDLNSALAWGGLPKMLEYSSTDDKQIFLETYAHTYLKEEVWDEHLIRKLNPFRKFLQIAAQSNGSILNYSKLADDVRVDTKTVQQYFQILEDTLLGLALEPYHISVRKRQRANPKFYFFDTGVTRALDRSIGLPLKPQNYVYGRLFETFIILELHRLNSYLRKNYSFSYLKTSDNAEIDLVIERPGLPLALVEIKSTKNISKREVSGLSRFAPDFPKAELYCLSCDDIAQRFDRISALPWQRAITELGLGV